MSSARPFLSIWFGNFFEPFYNDREAVQRGIAEAADLGFNAINLDSKPWEDFFSPAFHTVAERSASFRRAFGDISATSIEESYE